MTDVWQPALDAIAAAHPDVRTVADTDTLVRERLDVYAPCALGGALTDDVVEVLSARVVCGAANNQLDHPGIEKLLADRGILYAPDYCVNSGGLIQVADELVGFSFDRAKQRATKIFDTTRDVFRLAEPTASRRRSPPTASPSSASTTDRATARRVAVGSLSTVRCHRRCAA